MKYKVIKFKTIIFGNQAFDVPNNVDWENVHLKITTKDGEYCFIHQKIEEG